MIIELPYKLDLYPYQKKAWNALFHEHKRHILLVLHRRAGKTLLMLNIATAFAMKKVALYLLVFPQISQAKLVVWDAIDEQGRRFIDYIPKELIDKINNSEMKITFKNGSIIKLIGIDKSTFNKKMGANAFGVFFDEYSIQNPAARNYMAPIILKNGGFEMLTFTPRGNNHGYRLYNEAMANPNIWHCQYLPVDKTFDNEGKNIFPVEDISALGLDEDTILQELYLSWTASSSGTYFSKELKNAEEDKRITNFAVDSTIPTFTFWDIGWKNATAIWVFQFYMNEIRAIAYYENCFEELNHYWNWVDEFGVKNNLHYKEHFLPHDSEHMKATSDSYINQSRQLGKNVSSVERIPNKKLAIDITKSIFSRVFIRMPACERGLDCLRNYRAKWNDILMKYGDEPYKDWSTDGTDAFMLMAQVQNKMKGDRNYEPNIKPNLLGTDIFSNKFHNYMR